jgi:hypothetical protein
MRKTDRMQWRMRFGRVAARCNIGRGIMDTMTSAHTCYFMAAMCYTVMRSMRHA